MILDRARAMYVTRRQVSALSFFGPQGHGWCDPGQIQGVPGLAMVTSPGSVRNAKCWVSSGAIASSTDFIHAFLPRPGISTTGNIHGLSVVSAHRAGKEGASFAYSARKHPYPFPSVYRRMGDIPR